MNKLRILIDKDIHQVKNYLKSFNNNRKKLIPVVFYILWFYFMFKSQTDNNFYSVNYFKNFSFGILTFLLIISLINIYFERTSYFNMADVNLLFTAPIDSKLVLIYAIFKTSWKQMLAALFMFVFLSPSLINAGIQFPRLLIGVLAYVLFIFAIEPIGFIVSQLSKKYDLKILLSGLVISLLVMVSIPMILLKSPVEGIQSNYMNYVPIIGWSRGIFMGMFQIDSFFFLYIFAMVVFNVLINLYIIKTSDNYYEDVITATENKEKYSSKKKQGKASLNISFNFNKNKNIRIKGDYQGAKAFHWKNKLKAIREDFHYLFGVQTLLFLIISVAMVFVKGYKNIEIPYPIMYMWATAIILYIYTLFSLNAGGEDELEMHFFYLIPENNIKKIIALNQLNFQRMAINSVAFFIIPIIIDFRNFISYLLLFLVFNSVYWMIKYAYVLVKSIFRNETDFTFMLPLIKVFQLLLVILPSVIGGFIGAAFSEVTKLNPEFIVLSSVFTINLVAVLLILVLADTIINRIEL